MIALLSELQRSFIFSLNFHLVFRLDLTHCHLVSSLLGNFKPGVYAVSVTGRLPQGNNNHDSNQYSFTVPSSEAVLFVTAHSSAHSVRELRHREVLSNLSVVTLLVK